VIQTSEISRFMPFTPDVAAGQTGEISTEMLNGGTINALMPLASGSLLNDANTKISNNVRGLGNPLGHMIQGPTASGFKAREIHGDKLRQAEDAANNIGVSGGAEQRAKTVEDAGRASIAAAQKSYTDNIANQQQAQGQLMRDVAGNAARGRSNSAMMAGLGSATQGVKPISSGEIQGAAQGMAGAMSAGAGIRTADYAQSAGIANAKMDVADRYKTTIDPSLYEVNRRNAVEGTNTGIEQNLAAAIPYLGGGPNGSGMSGTGGRSPIDANKDISGGGSIQPDGISAPQNTEMYGPPRPADSGTGPWQGPIKPADSGTGEWQGPLQPEASSIGEKYGPEPHLGEWPKVPETGPWQGPIQQKVPNRTPAKRSAQTPKSKPPIATGMDSSAYQAPNAYGHGFTTTGGAQDFGDIPSLASTQPKRPSRQPISSSQSEAVIAIPQKGLIKGGNTKALANDKDKLFWMQ
jgi:hypothetical protein